MGRNIPLSLLVFVMVIFALMAFACQYLPS